MRFLHISDLHIGKKVKEYSMLDDQIVILSQIIDEAKKCDGVIIAGDIYDKAMPSAQAVEVVDKFISDLSELEIPVFIISGNHDSAQRISYASSILKKHNIFVSMAFNGYLQKVALGDIDIYMLPFIKPFMVRDIEAYNNEDISDYDKAVRAVINHSNVDESRVNILIAHQFVAGFEPSDSETLSLGGSDNVTASAFDSFDYVALGHIHKPQKLMRDTIRYSGSPLKYSKSEANFSKSMTVVDVKSKNDISLSFVPFKPRRDMRIVKGGFDDIMAMPYSEDYVFVTSSDDEPPYDAIGRLRTVFPNIMGYENLSSVGKNDDFIIFNDETEKKSPSEYFEDFFKSVTGKEQMNEFQKGIIADITSRREEQ